jgi:hypothetical protein
VKKRRKRRRRIRTITREALIIMMMMMIMIIKNAELYLISVRYDEDSNDTFFYTCCSI